LVIGGDARADRAAGASSAARLTGTVVPKATRSTRSNSVRPDRLRIRSLMGSILRLGGGPWPVHRPQWMLCRPACQGHAATSECRIHPLRFRGEVRLPDVSRTRAPIEAFKAADKAASPLTNSRH